MGLTEGKLYPPHKGTKSNEVYFLSRVSVVFFKLRFLSLVIIWLTAQWSDAVHSCSQVWYKLPLPWKLSVGGFRALWFEGPLPAAVKPLLTHTHTHKSTSPSPLCTLYSWKSAVSYPEIYGAAQTQTQRCFLNNNTGKSDCSWIFSCQIRWKIFLLALNYTGN